MITRLSRQIGKWLLAKQINDQFNNASTLFFYNFGTSVGLGSEANRTGVFTSNGRATGMAIHVAFNSTTTDTTLTLRINLSDTAMVLTMTSGDTGQFIATGSIPYLQGDRFSSQISAVAIGEVINNQGYSLEGIMS